MNKILLLSSLILSISIGCTRALEEDANGSKLILNLPNKVTSKVSSQKLGSSGSWGLSSVAALGEIDCYAIAVEGPEDYMHNNKCVDSGDAEVFKTGLFVGPFQAGSQVALPVPSGPERTIRIIGFAASGDDISQCRNFFDPNFDESLLSPPVVISEKTVNLPPGDVVVNMTASMTGSVEFDDCSGPLFDGFGGTAPAGPTLSVIAPTGASKVNAAVEASFNINGTCSEEGQNVVFTGDVATTVTCTSNTFSYNADVSGQIDGAATVNFCVDHQSVGGDNAPQICFDLDKDTVAPSSVAGFTTTPVTVGMTDTPLLDLSTAGNDGDLVRFYSDACSTEIGNQVIAGGVVSVTSSSLGGEATYSIYAQAEDAAGNVTSCDSLGSYTLDTTPPADPSALGIQGVISDATPDGVLTDGYQVDGVWTDNAADENEYLVELIDTDATTPICAAANIAANSTSHTFATPACDIDPGGNYFFRVTAVDAAGNLSSQMVKTFTVDAPTISIDDPSDTESNAMVSFTISLSHPTASDVTVDYTTADGSATTADSDYTAASGTATITAGSTSTTVDVVVSNDTKFENDETLDLNLSNPLPSANASISDASGTATVTNDDAMPSISYVLASSNADESVATANIDVQLSAVSGMSASIDVGVSGGTAVSGTDFTYSGETLTFLPGETSKTINVSISDDVSVEANETIILNFSSNVNASVGGTPTHTYTINDNDVALAVLTITDGPTYDFGTHAVGGTQTHTFTINNTGSATATAMTGSLTTGTQYDFYLGGGYPGSGGSCTATLAPAGTCTIVVQFAPVGAGTHNDTIDISYHDGSATQNTLRNITGEGATPANITITESGSYDYGDVVQFAESTHTFTLENTGGVTATGITDIGLAPPFDFDGGFPGAGGDCVLGGSIVASATCNIVVRFSPSGTGLVSDSISVQYNNGLSTITSDRGVQGNGVTPALLTISEINYDFGLIEPLESAVHTFSITNTGETDATLVGENAFLTSHFIYKGSSFPGSPGGTCTSTLLAGASCDIVVEVSPSSIGSFNDDISINYNDGVSGQIASNTIYVEGGVLPFGNGSEGSYTINVGTGSKDGDSDLSGRTFAASFRVASIANDADGTSTFSLISSPNVADYQVGDKALWIVVAAGTTACSTKRGAYGIAVVDSVTGSNIGLSIPPPAGVTPDNNAPDVGTNFCYVQLVRIPEFNNLTIDSGYSLAAAQFDPTLVSGGGGIIPIMVNGTLNMTASTISASDKGLIGGKQTSINNYSGMGIAGLAPNVSSDLAKGITGGGGSISGVAGAGGGNVGLGADNSTAAYGGDSASECPGLCSPRSTSAITSPGNSRIFMGGGAGWGGSGGAYGGNGGGIVMIFAQTIIGSGTIDVSGGNGYAGGSGAGGGAGGSIFIKSYDINMSGYSIHSNGGNGVSSGGGGGGGMFYYEYCTNTSLPTGEDITYGTGGTGASSGQVISSSSIAEGC